MPGVLNLINVAFVSEPTYVSFTKLVYSFRVMAQISRLHKTTGEITIIINEAYYEIRKRRDSCYFRLLRNASSCSPVCSCVRVQQRSFHSRDFREISYSRVTKICLRISMLVQNVQNWQTFHMKTCVLV